jgi:hypothetical protein
MAASQANQDGGVARLDSLDALGRTAQPSARPEWAPDDPFGIGFGPSSGWRRWRRQGPSRHDRAASIVGLRVLSDWWRRRRHTRERTLGRRRDGWHFGPRRVLESECGHPDRTAGGRGREWEWTLGSAARRLGPSGEQERRHTGHDDWAPSNRLDDQE